MREPAQANRFDQDFRSNIKRVLPRRWYLDVGGDFRNTILIAGSGRSGTSWIPDAVNVAGDYRYLYEPFDPWHVPMMRSWRLRQYIRPDSVDPRFVLPARRIFSGAIRNGWVDEFTSHGIYRKRIIKDVLLMLALGWIRRQFRGVPIILLVRHPIAVALSRSAHAGLSANFEVGNPPYWDQPELVKDHLDPFLREIKNASDAFERHLYCWCAENYVALRQLAAGDVHLAFYERFCEDPRAELDGIFRFLGMPFDERVMTTISRPSHQAKSIEGGPTSAILSGDNPVEAWRKRASDADILRARRILDRFGLDDLYGERSMPDPVAAARLFEELKAR